MPALIQAVAGITLLILILSSGFTIGEPKGRGKCTRALELLWSYRAAAIRSVTAWNWTCLISHLLLVLSCCDATTRNAPSPPPSSVRTSIPDWWIWAYWLSPFSWAFRALVVNEFTYASSWGQPINPANPSGPSIGDAALDAFGFFHDRFWIWAAVGYL
jgi:hypothetical protein